MTSVLDCGSFDTALSSVANLAGSSPESVIADLLSVRPEDLEAMDGHPDGWVYRACFGVADVPRADRVHWYHATRTWPDVDFLASGIRPLDGIEEELWDRLGFLARAFEPEGHWTSFRRSFFDVPTSGARQLAARRCVPTGGGPYAFLIRDAIFRHDRGQPTHYLDCPETVSDICWAYEERFGHPLLDRFRNSTRRMIVKFVSPYQHGDEIFDAINYVHAIVHRQPEDYHRTRCFSGKGRPVEASAILGVETLD